MAKSLLNAVEEWAAARKELLDAIARSEEWLKDAKRGGKEVVPNVLDPYWARLANAEADLYREAGEM